MAALTSAQAATSDAPTYKWLAWHAVDAGSASDVWAVGNMLSGNPFIERWDGTRWSQVSTPIDGNEYIMFASIAMRAADDGWAVGIQYLKHPDRAVILHWDGTSWTRVTAPEASGPVTANDVGAALPTMRGWSETRPETTSPRSASTGTAPAGFASRAQPPAWTPTSTP